TICYRDWSSDVCSSDLTSHSASASLVATTELQPWAMLPNGPQWMNAGPPPSRCAASSWGWAAGIEPERVAVVEVRVQHRGQQVRAEERRVGDGRRRWGR